MKKIRIVFLTAILILLASCEKKPFIKLGFETSIDRYSNGFVMVHISANEEKFHLIGVISLYDGQAVVSLTNPAGFNIYSSTTVALFSTQNPKWSLNFNTKL